MLKRRCSYCEVIMGDKPGTEGQYGYSDGICEDCMPRVMLQARDDEAIKQMTDYFGICSDLEETLYVLPSGAFIGNRSAGNWGDQHVVAHRMACVADAIFLDVLLQEEEIKPDSDEAKKLLKLDQVSRMDYLERLLGLDGWDSACPDSALFVTGVGRIITEGMSRVSFEFYLNPTKDQIIAIAEATEDIPQVAIEINKYNTWIELEGKRSASFITKLLEDAKMAWMEQRNKVEKDIHNLGAMVVKLPMTIAGKALEQKAIDAFGVTDDPQKCSYVFKSGLMLPAGKATSKAIAAIMPETEKKAANNSEKLLVKEFMGRTGAIRINVKTGVVEAPGFPVRDQTWVISEVAEKSILGMITFTVWPIMKGAPTTRGIFVGGNKVSVFEKIQRIKANRNEKEKDPKKKFKRNTMYFQRSDFGLQGITTGKDQTSGQELIDRAVKHFGLTDKVKLGGFVLPDGRILNFSGDGYSRNISHSEVSNLFSEFEQRSMLVYMGANLEFTRAFMRRTNAVRLGYAGFEAPRLPTSQQLEVLSDKANVTRSTHFPEMLYELWVGWDDRRKEPVYIFDQLGIDHSCPKDILHYMRRHKLKWENEQKDSQGLGCYGDSCLTGLPHAEGIVGEHETKEGMAIKSLGYLKAVAGSHLSGISKVITAKDIYKTRFILPSGRAVRRIPHPHGLDFFSDDSELIKDLGYDDAESAVKAGCIYIINVTSTGGDGAGYQTVSFKIPESGVTKYQRLTLLSFLKDTTDTLVIENDQFTERVSFKKPEDLDDVLNMFNLSGVKEDSAELMANAYKYLRDVADSHDVVDGLSVLERDLKKHGEIVKDIGDAAFVLGDGTLIGFSDQDQHLATLDLILSEDAKNMYGEDIVDPLTFLVLTQAIRLKWWGRRGISLQTASLPTSVQLKILLDAYYEKQLSKYFTMEFVKHFEQKGYADLDWFAQYRSEMPSEKEIRFFYNRELGKKWEEAKQVFKMNRLTSFILFSERHEEKVDQLGNIPPEKNPLSFHGLGQFLQIDGRGL